MHKIRLPDLKANYKSIGLEYIARLRSRAHFNQSEVGSQCLPFQLVNLAKMDLRSHPWALDSWALALLMVMLTAQKNVLESWIRRMSLESIFGIQQT